MASDLESQMVSVERISEYTNMKQEKPHYLPSGTEDSRLEKENWPQRGRVVFEQVNMRYRADLPLVLKDLNLTIEAGERIGIVGRTATSNLKNAFNERYLR